jgi:hypothetical protein
MAVFWVVAPCSLVEVFQRFRGSCCLHHLLHGATTQKTAVNVDPACGCWLRSAHMMETVCSSETLATQLTSTRRQHPEAGSTLTMNYRESLKSVTVLYY